MQAQASRGRGSQFRRREPLRVERTRRFGTTGESETPGHGPEASTTGQAGRGRGYSPITDQRKPNMMNTPVNMPISAIPP
jgi:hypothetical protein